MRRYILVFYNNNQKTKSTGIICVAFPKKGKNKKTDVWRVKLMVFVGRSNESFNPNKHHICTARFDRSSLLYNLPYGLTPQDSNPVFRSGESEAQPVSQ